MSAAEVIEQIKKLPPDEVRAVQVYLENVRVPPKEVEYVPVEEAVKAAEKMFNRYPDLFKKLAE